jgi:hypothetical protein
LKEPVNDPVNGDVIVKNCNELETIFDGIELIPEYVICADDDTIFNGTLIIPAYDI